MDKIEDNITENLVYLDLLIIKNRELKIKIIIIYRMLSNDLISIRVEVE
jgi:hypothetical protein